MRKRQNSRNSASHHTIHNTAHAASSLLVVGLGNPDARYEHTRHNVGFWVLERYAALHNITFEKKRNMMIGRVGEGMLLKPLTYMNRSGEALAALRRKLKISWMRAMIVCDTLDLPVGGMRIKRGGGNGGHRGIQSIIEHGRGLVADGQFARLYIGIGRPSPPNSNDLMRKIRVRKYVLDKPSSKEREALEPVIDAAVQVLDDYIGDLSIDDLMNRYN